MTLWCLRLRTYTRQIALNMRRPLESGHESMQWDRMSGSWTATGRANQASGYFLRNTAGCVGQFQYCFAISYVNRAFLSGQLQHLLSD